VGSLAAVDALRLVDGWPCDNVAVAVTGAVDAAHGEVERRFPWASVSKLASTVAILVAAEEGIVDLDEPAGPPGSTVRHLLAHASGLPFDAGAPIARPGTRRIYSNYGIEVAVSHVEERAEMPFPEYFAWVWEGTGMTLEGSAAHAVHGTVADLVALAHELQQPARIAQETLDEARAAQFPGLVGVLPGFGRQDPNDWGLGFELRDGKHPHWTGARNSPRAFGHFGRSGTFLWVDPDAGIALACLTDLAFGDWAADAWPRLSDAVLAESALGRFGQELE
jgi:CubicO group peptidase (beta-lactamase class C family)